MVLALIILSAVVSVAVVLTQRGKDAGCQAKLIRTESHFFSLPNVAVVDVEISAPDASFTFVSTDLGVSSALEIDFGVWAMVDPGILGEASTNETAVRFQVQNRTLAPCEQLVLNVSASLDVISNISLSVEAGSITLESLNATFSHLSLTSYWTNGTVLEGVQFNRARLLAAGGPVNVQGAMGNGLHIEAGAAPISVRGTTLDGLYVQTWGTNDITLQELSTQRLTAVASQGTIYAGVQIVEPPESAEDCSINITSQQGNVLLTAGINSNKSCTFTAVCQAGDFTGTFIGFQGFYTVVLSPSHADLPQTSCSINATTQLKTCVGEIGTTIGSRRRVVGRETRTPEDLEHVEARQAERETGLAPEGRRLGREKRLAINGPTHILYVEVLKGLVSLAFD